MTAMSWRRHRALARLGAAHLYESERVLPSEHVEQVNDVVREALLSREPRLVTALAPVLARYADHVRLRVIDDRLIEAGLEVPLQWLVENTLEALRSELIAALARPWAQAYRRAAVVLDAYRERVASRTRQIDVLDILDSQIRPRESFDEVRAKRSSLSERWGIVSSLQPVDFATTLRSPRVDHWRVLPRDRRALAVALSPCTPCSRVHLPWDRW